MKRRRFLALGVAGIAGCGGGDSPVDRTTEPPPLSYGTITRDTPTPRRSALPIDASAHWPQFAADAANTGHRPGFTGPTEPPGTAWEQWTLGEVTATPVVAGRRILVATHPPESDESERGRVHAFDRATGAALWTRVVPGPVAMAPATADGRLHVLAGRRTLVTLGLDGAPLWERSVPPVRSESAPTVANGAVFVASTEEDTLTACDTASGETVWQQSIPTPMATPAVADGTVFVATEQERVLALDAATGEQRWEFSSRDYQRTRAAPAVGPDHVAVAPQFGPTTLVLDRATGEQVWAEDTDDRPRSSPAIADGTVVSADRGGTVVAYDIADGTERWRASTPPVIASPPTVAGGVVYVAGTPDDPDMGEPEGRIDAFALADGRRLFRRDLDSAPGGSVVAMDGLAYAALEASRVVCLR